MSQKRHVMHFVRNFVKRFQEVRTKHHFAHQNLVKPLANHIVKSIVFKLAKFYALIFDM